MLSGGRFSAPTVNDRTYQIIINMLPSYYLYVTKGIILIPVPHFPKNSPRYGKMQYICIVLI